MNNGALRLESDPVDIGNLIRKVVAEFRPVANHVGSKFQLSVPDSGLIALGDTLAIEQILDNLIGNAIKYAPGSVITIASRDEQPGMVRLSIEDYGPGLSEEDQLRIFSALRAGG